MMEDGAPGATRTRDPLLRRQMLYPIELQAQPHAISHGLAIAASRLCLKLWRLPKHRDPTPVQPKPQLRNN
jgi:hypothetical protein